MEIYRIPRHATAVRVLLDDGRSIEGSVFTADAGPGGRPEDLLDRLNDTSEDFVPLSNGDDSVLVNKSGIVWVQASGEGAREIVESVGGGRRVPVRLSLAGGLGVVGTLSVVMPPERSRVLDYLNAAGRFVPLFGEGAVTLVQRGYIVLVRAADEPRPL